MFGKSQEAGVTRSQSLIQEGVTLKGEMKAEGDIRLDGSLEGTLSSKSRVTVGVTGAVNADIEAAEVLIMGRVRGKVTGHRRVELRKGAHVEGDLTTQSLVIEEGVFFQGFSQMNVVPVSASMSSGDTRAAAHGDVGKGLDKDLFPKGATKNNG
jgi:cytoskeletal protein CcmA (bactofilin family)